MNNYHSTKEFLKHFTQNHRKIYTFIRAQVRCSSDADDLLQETSVLLWEKFDEFDRSADFGRWACGFARRLILRYHRENGRVKPLFSEAVDQLFADQLLVSLQSDNDRSDALVQCLEELDQRQRILLDQRYRSEREVSDIADAVQRSESAVYKALAKIHETLFQCVQKKLSEWGAT